MTRALRVGRRRRWSRSALAGAAFAIALLVLFARCGDLRGAKQPWLRPGDTVWREVASTGRLDSPALDEASGLAPSGRTPGLFWALNDSGNDPELFALDPSGHVRSVVSVTGARNRDWEALAPGPCPAAASCLFIGDVGDNLARRDGVQIYWMAEPPAPVGLSVTTAQGRIDVRFADGPHDVEAMYVGADTSLWLVTKRPEDRPDGSARPSRLYRVAPHHWNDPTPLAVVDSVPIVPQRRDPRDWITDATLSAPDSTGQRKLALLTYGAVYVLAADPVTGRPGALLGRCALPIRETSSEGLSWLPDGRLLLINEGTGSRLYAGKCP